MASKRARWIRLGILFAVVIALVIIGAATGMREKITVANIRAQATAAGPWGVLGFGVAFSVGSLLYVPGTVFFIAAILVWGRVAGGGVAFVSAVLAVLFSFVLVRAAGGQVLAESRRPFVQKILSRIDRYPIQTVALLRLIFWTSPPINYALALTSIKFRDHLIGSALGLILPVIGMALFTEMTMRFLGLV
jgi:uncharacterized membrane protein YdjX (TVP38/TMEM64 family)